MTRRPTLLIWCCILVAGAVSLPAQDADTGEDDTPEQDTTTEDSGDRGQQESRPRETHAPSGADGAFRMQVIPPTAWRAAGVTGEGVRLGLGGSAVYLEIGGRYHIDLRGVDSEQLPADIHSGGGRVLLSQREAAESVAGEEVDAQVSGEGMTFTLTEGLAARISYIRAAPYTGMRAFIFPYGGESAGAQSEGEASEVDAGSDAAEQGGSDGAGSDSADGGDQGEPGDG
jgi:hypothetical protein